MIGSSVMLMVLLLMLIFFRARWDGSCVIQMECTEGQDKPLVKELKMLFESELQALIVAMQQCWSKGYKRVVFESDCQKMVNLLNKQGLHLDGYNWIRGINW